MQKKTKILLVLALALLVVLTLFVLRSYFFDKFGIKADVAQKEKVIGSKSVKNGDFGNDKLVRLSKNFVAGAK